MNWIEECWTIMPTRTGEEIIWTDSLDYYYSKLWFWLQFPEERSGYIKKPDMSRFVYFSLNHRQMFYIYAQPLDAYKKHGLLRKEPLWLTYLGKNNKYMFYSTIYPVDYVWRHKPEYTPSIEMKERIAEVKSIIWTFYMNDI